MITPDEKMTIFECIKKYEFIGLIYVKNTATMQMVCFRPEDMEFYTTRTILREWLHMPVKRHNYNVTRMELFIAL